MKLSKENVWLNINKPVEMSSAKVVAVVKRWTRAKKVGHGGTLDLMAEGVLPIALNRATKTSNDMMGEEKGYFFRVKWGAFTSSDDIEGEVIEESDKRPKTADICACILSFLGEIDQVPSKFSALRIDGKKAYELARKGVEFEIKSRKVTIFSIKLLKNDENYADFEIKCSKGTYVRSLARDICKKLGVCGHVVKLVRQSVGDISLENSVDLQKLRDFVRNPYNLSDLKEIKWIKSVNITCNN